MSDYWKIVKPVEKLRWEKKISDEGSVMRLESIVNRFWDSKESSLGEAEKISLGIGVVKRLGF